MGLKYMIIINEPDLKMPSTALFGGGTELYRMCRAIISAFDGMLEAEQEAGVTGPLINFTATFSFALCTSCEFSYGKPALAQMSQLDDAMRHPGKYDYTPRNNITAAYLERFTHSFNTQNPAWDIRPLFLNAYEEKFPSMPVFIAEYHRPHMNQSQDLATVMQIAEGSDLLLGISFFQFQVAYWKTGSEMEFGMFGLGEEVVASMPYFSKTYDVYCLQPEESPASGRTFADIMTHVYGGPGIDSSTLCSVNPLGVQLDQAGYVQIASQQSVSQMVLFVGRVLHHMGAVVQEGYHPELEDFALNYVGDVATDAFARMAGYLGGRPGWAEFDPEAMCVADREVHPSIIASGIDWVCSQEGPLCGDIPEQCSANPYRLGDFVFSRFAREAEVSTSWNPLVDCSFAGAALFAPSDVYEQWVGAHACAAGGSSTTSSTSLTSTTTSTRSDTISTSLTSTTSTADVSITSTATGTFLESSDRISARPWLSAFFLGLLVVHA